LRLFRALLRLRMGVRRGGVTGREYKAGREYEVIDVGGNARVLLVYGALRYQCMRP
jgi:hypothetical protein